ncbi:hypothetical protein, partial [Rhizobium grahamii]
LLPGQFREFNRVDFKISMAQMATQQPVYRLEMLRPLQGRYDPPSSRLESSSRHPRGRANLN